MRRETSRSSPRDALRIDVDDSHDMRYWCARMKCTERQLKEAVSQVGPVPSNVEAYLRQRTYGLENLELPRGRKPS